MKAADAVQVFLRCALSSEGAQEVPAGSNRGAYVERILKQVGLGPGNPWCAAAVYDWGFQALGKAWPLPATGGCQVLAEFAESKGWLVETPEAGDVLLIWHEPLKRFGHTGAVLRPKAPNATLSGNTTGPGGSTDPKLAREGWCVAKKPWVFTPQDRFIRWSLAFQ